MYGPNGAIFTHVWVLRYETHMFHHVDSGQWDTPGFGASHYYQPDMELSFPRSSVLRHLKKKRI